MVVCKVTPEEVQRIRKIKEDYPDISYQRIAKRVVEVSSSTIRRILKGEYSVEGNSVIRRIKSE